VFRNMVIFYGEELLAPRPTPKLEDHPLSAVRDCIFAATLHIWKLFLRPQPEDAPCRGDRDPLIMGSIAVVPLILRGDCSTSRPGRLSPVKNRCTQRIEGWMRPRASLDLFKWNKCILPLQMFETWSHYLYVCKTAMSNLHPDLSVKVESMRQTALSSPSAPRPSSPRRTGFEPH
jgi:hypothetical protein